MIGKAAANVCYRGVEAGKPEKLLRWFRIDNGGMNSQILPVSEVLTLDMQ